MEEVASTGELKHVVLRSGRQKDGRGNISPTTIILPVLAEECKLEEGAKIDYETIFNEMISQFKQAEGREPTEDEVTEIKSFLADVRSN